jgi:hypothetical protein
MVAGRNSLLLSLGRGLPALLTLLALGGRARLGELLGNAGTSSVESTVLSGQIAPDLLELLGGGLGKAGLLALLSSKGLVAGGGSALLALGGRALGGSGASLGRGRALLGGTLSLLGLGTGLGLGTSPGSSASSSINELSLLSIAHRTPDSTKLLTSLRGGKVGVLGQEVLTTDRVDPMHVTVDHVFGMKFFQEST